jgi:hypothetical protein
MPESVERFVIVQRTNESCVTPRCCPGAHSVAFQQRRQAAGVHARACAQCGHVTRTLSLGFAKCCRCHKLISPLVPSAMLCSVAARYVCRTVAARASHAASAKVSLRPLLLRTSSSAISRALPNSRTMATNVSTQYGTTFPAIPRAHGIAKVSVGAGAAPSAAGHPRTIVQFLTKEALAAAAGTGLAAADAEREATIVQYRSVDGGEARVVLVAAGSAKKQDVGAVQKATTAAGTSGCGASERRVSPRNPAECHVWRGLAWAERSCVVG